MKKQFVFVAILAAMVVLTLMPVSLVRAEDIGLKPISGSDCDPTTFEYRGHTIAEGLVQYFRRATFKNRANAFKTKT